VSPNLGLAHLSNDLFFAAVLCYAFAMLGFAAEFAFSGRFSTGGERSRSESATVALQAPPVGSRVLVGVGASAAAGTGSLPAGVGAASGPPAVPPTVVPGGHRADRGPDSGLGGGPDGASRATRIVGHVALALTVIGWVIHIGSVVSRGLAAHRVPWGNMYEFSSMACLLAVTTFLFLLTRYRVRYLGAFVMVPVVLYMGLAGTVLYAPAGPLVPALNSYWLKIHVVAAMGSSAIFMVGGVVTVLYLIRQRWERLTAAGESPRWAGLGGVLPAARNLDTLAYRVIAFAFPVWTFAIIAGAIWAEAAWGRYWGWDPKETWSFITWVVYACYLHARATSGWRGRRAAMIALAGFACLAVDYYVVNIWISGLHSYAGLG
jgi:cytochrome c-type biogenesis protein CcsB